MELFIRSVQILRCINHLSGDPNCLETLQRTDAIKHLIPILELRDGPLVYQIHSEVCSSFCYPSMLLGEENPTNYMHFLLLGEAFESIFLKLSYGPCSIVAGFSLGLRRVLCHVEIGIMPN